MARTPAASCDFARSFGDSLARFLSERKIRPSDAARRLGVGKARLNAYFHDSPDPNKPDGKKRSSPDAVILYRACALLGFEFTYNGFKITASTLAGASVKPIDPPAEQLVLDFDRQFQLTDERGTVAITFKRPAGRVEVSFSLKAVG